MKKGFSSVYIVLILTSFILLVLVLIEASTGYAAGSIGENICLVAGESVLSEFEPELYSRYGVFALKSDNYVLEKLACYYIKTGLTSYASPVKLSLKSCSIDAALFSGLDYKLFKQQIDALGTMLLAKEALSTTDVFKAMKAADDAEEYSSEDYDSALDSLSGNGKSSGEGESSASKRKRKQIKELKKRLKEAKEEDKYTALSDKYISSSQGDLPSRIYNCKTRNLLLLSGGLKDISADSITVGKYIVSSLGNYTKEDTRSVLRLEAEYVLYGNKSDSANEKAVRSSLFKLRLALNMADILTDEKKLARITAEAAAFSLIPYPVAFGILLFAESSVTAKSDVSAILKGEEVPLFKGVSALKGSYEDYIWIFLLLIPEDERMLRLMDIMQLNLQKSGSNFCFENYAYGFEMNVNLIKKTYLLNNRGVRNGSFTQIHKYI